MKLQKNPKALAIFNKIFITTQILDSAKTRTQLCETKEYIDWALKTLEEVNELFCQFVEDMDPAPASRGQRGAA